MVIDAHLCHNVSHNCVHCFFSSGYYSICCTRWGPLSCNRWRLSYNDCLEVRRKNNQNCSVLYCVQQLCTMIHRHMWTDLKFACWFRFRFIFVCLFRFNILCIFCVNLDYFIPVLLAFVVWVQFLQFQAKRLVTTSVSKITYSMSSGM